MSPLVQWLLGGISAGTLVMFGIAYGDIRARLKRIEQDILTGNQGFITRAEIELLKKQADHAHDDIYRRLERLEEKKEKTK